MVSVKLCRGGVPLDLDHDVPAAKKQRDVRPDAPLRDHCQLTYLDLVYYSPVLSI